MSGEDIWAAYASTRVTVDAPDGTLVVTPADDGDGTLDEVWHVITAHNPGSVMLPPDDNKARHEELLSALRDARRVVVPAAGQGLDGIWSPEESVAVRDIDTGVAVEIGREFGQLAVFRLGPDRISVIDCSTAEVRSSRRLHLTHRGAS